MAGILLDYSGAHIRLFFRILFFVLFLLIGIVGNKCLAARARFKLVRGQSVRLPLLSSWLSSFDSLLALNTIKDWPGGWLGFVMIAAYLLNLGSDFTSALVQTVSVHSRCAFGTGLVFSSSNDALTLVPWNGKPYSVVAQAQVTSLINNGMQGIYKKANLDLNFSADATDVLGNWYCTRNSIELDYSWDTSVPEIVTDIVQHGLLYENPAVTSSDLGNVSHIVIVGTSAGMRTGSLFDVRVSVDTSAFGNETHHMQSYECKLNDTFGHLQTVQRGINSSWTISDWIQVFQGSVYYGTGTNASNNTGGILEQVLNSMIMVAGGNNYLLDSSHALDTQGCLTTRTYLLWELIVLAGLMALILIFLLLLWLVLAIQLNKWSRQMKPEDVRWIRKYTPIGTFPWMAQAVRESALLQGTRIVDMADLKAWYFGKTTDERGYRIVGRGAAHASGEETVPLGSSSWRMPREI